MSQESTLGAFLVGAAAGAIVGAVVAVGAMALLVGIAVAALLGVALTVALVALARARAEVRELEEQRRRLDAIEAAVLAAARSNAMPAPASWPRPRRA